MAACAGEEGGVVFGAQGGWDRSATEVGHGCAEECLYFRQASAGHGRYAEAVAVWRGAGLSLSHGRGLSAFARVDGGEATVCGDWGWVHRIGDCGEFDNERKTGGDAFSGKRNRRTYVSAGVG